ncbi:hypothetical protein, partial [Asaia bogorensis]|uniref:hypothetical protein n=1 Tax=Asaia bogorensis TaxID=91915 RepID=UPI0013CEC85F
MTARRYRTAPATPAAALPAAGDMLSFRAVYQLHQKLEGQRQRRLGSCSALAILALTGLGIWAASTLRATPPLPYA